MSISIERIWFDEPHGEWRSSGMIGETRWCAVLQDCSGKWMIEIPGGQAVHEDDVLEGHDWYLLELGEWLPAEVEVVGALAVDEGDRWRWGR